MIETRYTRTKALADDRRAQARRAREAGHEAHADRLDGEARRLDRKAVERWAAPVVREHTVEVDGVEYERCVRALGIARCSGAVEPGARDCGGHN